MAQASQRQSDGSESELTLVDCDIHQSYATDDELVPYLPERYQSRGVVIPELLYRHESGTSRPDSFRGISEAPEGGYNSADVYAGSSKEAVIDHLDEHGVDYAFLTHQTDLTINGIPNSDYAFELARAVNEWVADEWLPEDERFLGSILVAMEEPEKSAEMIREYGDHPQFKQVLIQSAAGRNPFGQEYYWPVYEAAEEMGLTMGVHLSSTGAGIMDPITAAGHPRTSLEWGALVPAVYMGLLASLISEGVMEKFPDLGFAFIECGYMWLPQFMWRMDAMWKARRSQVPWLEQRPSEYIYDQVRFTTQPAHMPDDPRNLTKLMETFGAEDLLMFSSDYPHHDTDDPDHALPPGLSESAQQKIYHRNAQELYGLPDDPSDLG
jgi:predicted TIM-barrel fold metal-dependent hydrolase